MNSVLYSFRKSISFIWLLVKQLSKPTPYDYLQNRYKVNKKFKKYILNEIFIYSFIQIHMNLAKVIHTDFKWGEGGGDKC